MNREIFAIQDQKDGLEPYQKIKVDRLIIAVMKVAGVENVYTDDRGLAKRARLCGMIPVSTAELPIPTEDRQINMEFHVPTDEIPDPEPLPDTEIEDNGEG